MQVLEQPN